MLTRKKPLTRKVPLKSGSKGLKRRYRAIGAATKAEKAHQDAQRADGCAMCRLLGLKFNEDALRTMGLSPCGPTRIHHRTIGDKHGQLQLGQEHTVGLGDWHHQGILMEVREGIHLRFLTKDEMRERFGPSLAHHKRAFLDVIADNLGSRSTQALQDFQDARIARREAA